jgi:hypothetical protein
MKLKVALYVNGAPKPERVIELEKPEVPEGWKAVGGPMKRRVQLDDKSVVEVRWITRTNKGSGRRKE